MLEENSQKPHPGVFVIAVLVLILAVGVLPWALARRTRDDLAVPTRTAPGVVATVQISPVSQGGGGLFNAVTVKFDGREAYYALTPDTDWRPVIGQPVTVVYRVGRRSGLPHIDRVTPTGPAASAR